MNDLDSLRETARKRFPKVAIIYHWLVAMRGGERVLERMIDLFPQADIFTHVYDPEKISDKINAQTVRTTFIDKLPRSKTMYKKYLPFMPSALERLNLRGYDLVISTETGPTKGVIAPPNSRHVCYVCTPMRYLWDHYSDYRESSGALSRIAMSLTFPSLRRWDVTSAARVDSFMADSTFVQNRIEKYWRRDSEVVFPPVAVDDFSQAEKVSDRYLWVSQMIRYKRPDIAIDAFNKSGKPLLMIGDGDIFDEMRKRAGPNIEMVRRMAFPDLCRAYAEAKALIFTPEEDFGIVPVESMASGRPVIAFGTGGARDTVVDGKTGLFFNDHDSASLEDALERFEAWLPAFSPEAAQEYARSKFAPELFDRRFLEHVLRD